MVFLGEALVGFSGGANSRPSLARYRFLVPVSTFTFLSFSLLASSLVTAATTFSFLPSPRIPPV